MVLQTGDDEVPARVHPHAVGFQVRPGHGGVPPGGCGQGVPGQNDAVRMAGAIARTVCARCAGVDVDPRRAAACAITGLEADAAPGAAAGGRGGRIVEGAGDGQIAPGVQHRIPPGGHGGSPDNISVR